MDDAAVVAGNENGNATTAVAGLSMAGNGNGNAATVGNGNGTENEYASTGLEEKTGQVIHPTPARQNLGLIFGMPSTSTTNSTIPSSSGGGTMTVDQLREKVSKGAVTGSAGMKTPQGDPFRPLRDLFKSPTADIGRIITMGLRDASNCLAVHAPITDLISLGARDYIIMVLYKKLREKFQVRTTTKEEEAIVIWMQDLQEQDNIEAGTGQPPWQGWPSDIF